MLRKIQEELEEELLIILWTRLRDAYLGSERSGGETNELEESLRVPERVKLWEWRGMYDRVAREYLDSSAGHQLMLAVDEVDSAGARSSRWSSTTYAESWSCAWRIAMPRGRESQQTSQRRYLCSAHLPVFFARGGGRPKRVVSSSSSEKKKRIGEGGRTRVRSTYVSRTPWSTSS
jgi:hypothetical protein